MFFRCLMLLSLCACWRAQAAESVVIPLKVAPGTGIAAGRDCRTWLVPVSCNSAREDFSWGCGGWTIISESFASAAGVKVQRAPDLAEYVDGSGQPIFAGEADCTMSFGGRQHRVMTKVMKDAYAGKGGTIGYEIARRFQWEIDPRGPTMTLRPLGTAPASQPIAILPLKDEDESLFVSVKIRGAAEHVALLPQSTDLQAGPVLQRKWDLASGDPADVKTYMGNVKTKVLTGRDAVALSADVVETNVMVILVGDPKATEETAMSRSGLGASFLNRFVYCVDADRKQLMMLARVPQAAAPAATRPARR